MAVSSDVRERWAKALTEFLGTLFLCLTVATAARAGISNIAPVSIGCVLMVCVYAGAHISGAHYNPAVTLAVLVRGGKKLSPLDGVVYVASQVAGSLCATSLSWLLVGDEAAYPVIGKDVNALSALLCEAVVSFALCSVVLHTGTTTAQAGNSHFGLAIGFTVLSGAVSVGRISGGAFNPAVGSMPLLSGGSVAADTWIYWVGPLVGGLAAGATFRLVAWQEFSEEASEVRKILAPCLVEFIGTAMLCFTVVLTGRESLGPLAIGSMLMVMIYMGGWISGGHFNPAVTLAVLVRSLLGASHGIFTWGQASRYVIAQLAGSVFAGFAAIGVVMGSDQTFTLPTFPMWSTKGQVFLGEFLGTFLLAYVVLNVATVKEVANNSYFGLAIGMVVTAMACGIGPITGGAFNPAVGTMSTILAGWWWDLVFYWSACPLGGLLAACCFRLQNFREFQADKQELCCADTGEAVQVDQSSEGSAEPTVAEQGKENGQLERFEAVLAPEEQRICIEL